MMMVRRRKEELSEKHKKILLFLAEYQVKFDRPPSIREICSRVGISSTSVVNYDLDQLVKRGYLERDLRVSRGLRLTDKVQEVIPIMEIIERDKRALSGSRLTERIQEAIHEIGDLLRVPIVGPIAAGLPLPDLQPSVAYVTENEAHAVEIARSLLPRKEKGDDLYALEVKGDSMIDAMINDGDIVVMKPAVEARNGEMVAVWLPDKNEATLKYFFKEKDGYTLKPANPSMKPIRISKNRPLEIKGKVVMVIRKMDTIKM